MFKSSSRFQEFIPKSYLHLKRGYSFAYFKKDFIAGVTVGMISLPLAMAFAIASGVEPARGLYTAIIAGFLISLLGGSRVQIGGPTGAFVVIIYDIIQRTGYQGLAVSSLIAAFLLIFFGLFRLGSWIKYIPHPLITGFTTGIAVLIFSSQIKDFFGLDMGPIPSQFIQKWTAYFQAFNSINPFAFAVSSGTLIIILLLRRFTPAIPWGIGALAVATFVTFLFEWPIETVQSRFGILPHTLPIPSLPYFSIPLTQMKEVIVDAISIAFLGGIESLLSAVIGDRIVGGKHKSNCELIAQGIGNFSAILFGGIPATGAIARTAVNAKTGAKTPLAGMIHAATLLFMMYSFSSVVGQIPLAALASVLIFIAWNMSEVEHLSQIIKAPLGDNMILLTALLLTVFVDITAAIFLGMFIACLSFIRQMSHHKKIESLKHLLTSHNPFSKENASAEIIESIQGSTKIYEIRGPFFFGTATLLQGLLQKTAPQKTCILRMLFISMIDASGLHALKEFLQECKKQNVDIKLVEAPHKVKETLQKFGIFAQLGKENYFNTLQEALSNTKDPLSKE